MEGDDEDGGEEERGQTLSSQLSEQLEFEHVENLAASFAFTLVNVSFFHIHINTTC